MTTRIRTRGHDRLPVVARAIPLLALVATGLPMALHSGGYYVASWGLAAAGCAALLVSLVASGSAASVRPHGLAARLAVFGFVAYAAWSLASATWAGDIDGAITEGVRAAAAALLVLTACTAARTGWHPRVVAGVAVSVAVLVAMIGLWQIIDDPATHIFRGRALGPVGYHNGWATWLLLPTWLAVWLALDRRLHVAVRGATLGAAALLGATSLLAQSRGALAAWLLAALVAVLVVPERRRLVLALLVPGACIALAATRITAVYRSLDVDDRVAAAAVDSAARTILFATAAAVACGIVWAWLDAAWGRRTRPPHRATEHRRHMPRRILVALPVALALIAAITVTTRVVDPVADRVRDDAQQRWERFVDPSIREQGGGDSRFVEVSNNGRLYLWDAALELGRDEPVLGVGAGNYRSWYYQVRDAPGGYVRQPHSVLLEAFAERGVPGLALLALALGATLTAAFTRRGLQDLDRHDRLLVPLLGVLLVQWVVHAQVDWLWQLTAVTWLPLIVAGIVFAAPWRPSPSPSGRTSSIVWCLPALATLLVVTPLWIADRHIDRSRTLQPAAARIEVDRAEQWNPWSVAAARRRVELARDSDDDTLGARGARELLDRAPDDWASWLIASEEARRRGDDAEAARLFNEARRRNPLGPEFDAIREPLPIEQP